MEILGGASIGLIIAAVFGFLMVNKGKEAKEWAEKAQKFQEETEKLTKEKRETESAGFSDVPTAVVVARAEAAAAAKEEIEALHTRIEEATQRAQDAAARAEAADARMKELETSAAQLTTTNRELEEKIESLNARAAEAAGAGISESPELSRLLGGGENAVSAEELAAAQTALEQANANLEQLNVSLEQTTANLEQTGISLVQANATLEQKNAYIEQVSSTLEQATSTLEQTQTELTTAKEALVASQEELDLVKAELEAVRSASGNAQAEKAEADTDLQALIDARDEALAARDAAIAEKEQLEQEQDERFQRLQTFAEEKVGKLMTDNRQLKAQLETMSGASAVGGDGGSERLLTLATLSPFGVFEADSAGNWRYANSSWTKISGLAAEDSTGSGWRKSIHENDRTGVESAWTMMITAGNPFSRTFRLETPEGSIRWVAMRAGQVMVGSEKTFVGAVEDITERRRAEESARSTSICLRSVVDASAESIIFLDRRGDITSWNRPAEKMFGYTQDEALSRSLLALLVPDDQAALRRALAKAAQTDQLHTAQIVEGLALCKNGSTMPVEVSAAAWRAGEFGEEDADIRYTVTVRDISERRRAEDFKRDKEAAEEANRAKSQFLANMSHELRTPLNAIIGFSEILHDRTFGDLTQKQERYVGNILSSGRHLLQLINDILDLSKVEAGHVQLEYVAFPVGVAIRNVEGLVKVLLQKKNLNLETQVPAELPVLIADQAKFKQILYNLVSNAIKFTPENGKVIIGATAIDNGATLQVSVTDTGIGIKQEDQDRVFKEFEQVDSSYARMQQGTGLGLALVKRFIDLHGGKIRVFSEGEGKGTTFIFTIPFQPSEEEETAAPVAAAVVEPTTGAKEKPIILVVDDDQSASELLTHHLNGAGYDVSRAFTASDALQLAREMQPRVITLDVQLPDGDGWTVLRALKGDTATRHIPVLMVSIIEDREKAQSLGAVECFVKPIVKERLLAAIAREATNPTPTRVSAPEVVPVAATNGNHHSPVETTPGDVELDDAERTIEIGPSRSRRNNRSRGVG